jgi:hypothetical protein
MLPGNSDSCYIHPVIHTIDLQIGNNVIIRDKMKSRNFNIIQGINYVVGQTDTLVELSHYSPTDFM